MGRIRLGKDRVVYDSEQGFPAHTVPAVGPAEIRAVIARRIRALAKERDITMTALADFAGVGRRSLHRALAGDEALTVDRLAKIAEALEVHPKQLLDEDEP